nr:MAG TPA: hypothetical protein [Caudoviricetes sp.]
MKPLPLVQALFFILFFSNWKTTRLTNYTPLYLVW